jgi:threonylcarbamoyladenosine tRNA methylthiotransferase MtaB
VEELPYTYLHVFPFSARPVTAAGNLPNQVRRRVRAARARDLREIGLSKGRSYRASRLGSRAHVVVETAASEQVGETSSHVGGTGAREAMGTSEDYLRVKIPAGNGAEGRSVRPGIVLSGLLTGYPDQLQLRA